MYKSFDQTASHTQLQALKAHLQPLSQTLSTQRLNSYHTQNGPLHYFFGTSAVTDEVLKGLQSLADECKAIAQYEEILAGKKWNTTENIGVHHHRTRDAKDRGFYGEQQCRVNEFVEKVRSGAQKGLTGKPFTHLIVMGIGGSELGPQSLYEALRSSCESAINVRILSNIDPDMMTRQLKNLPLDQTLICIVSKTGTTQETLTNFDALLAIVAKFGLNPIDFVAKQTILLTQPGSPMDTEAYLARFYLTPEIGGRLSSTSVGGGMILSLAFGPEIFNRLLTGASQQDEFAKSPSIRDNIALLAATIDIWHINYLGHNAKAYIPYSDALRCFPQHLEQLFCECNGKQIKRDNTPVTYTTCPAIMTGTGTNAQHSFFQMIHQGPNIIPVEFIGFAKSQNTPLYPQAEQQEKLLANLASQMIALAEGRQHENPHKVFPGNRPSTLVFADQLTPEVLGGLLAFYENTMMFQGFFWGINSFDQEGVVLGKLLTQNLLSANSNNNPILQHLFSMINPQNHTIPH